MTLTATLVLFLAMLILAVIPGPGMMIVVARTLSHGLWAGVATSVGIVAGDFVFILLAVVGMSSLALVLGEMFTVVKYLGAAYLLWLGVKLIFSRHYAQAPEQETKGSHTTSFVAGLVVTLANPKAILFYMSFFPAFVDLKTLGAMDVAIILLTATVAVGGVMLAYAFAAHLSRHAVRNTQAARLITKLSGGLLIGSGIYVAARS